MRVTGELGLNELLSIAGIVQRGIYYEPPRQLWNPSKKVNCEWLVDELKKELARLDMVPERVSKQP